MLPLFLVLQMKGLYLQHHLAKNQAMCWHRDGYGLYHKTKLPDDHQTGSLPQKISKTDQCQYLKKVAL